MKLQKHITKIICDVIIRQYNTLHMSKKSKMSNDIFEIMFKKEIDAFDSISRTDSSAFNKLKPINIQYIHQVKNTVSDKLFFVRVKFSQYPLLSEIGLEQFNHFQHLYHVMLKFINRCKLKRVQVHNNDCDLCMMPFDTMNPKKIIELSQNNCIYRFNIYELITIIKTSLTNNYLMIPSPHMPKNPYTNMEFEKHHLINIYIKIWSLKIKMNPLLHFFMESRLSIPEFANKHNALLLEISLDSLLEPDAIISLEVVTDMLSMIQQYSNQFLKINVNPHFSPTVLYKIFRPYLKLYYRIQLFGCDESKIKLKKTLCCFGLYNPFFGKRYIENTTGNVGFDDRHICFNDLVNGAFYELRDMTIFDMLKENMNNRGSCYCVSLMPIKNVKYVYGEKDVIQFPPLINPNDDEDETDDDIFEDEEDYDI